MIPKPHLSPTECQQLAARWQHELAELKTRHQREKKKLLKRFAPLLRAYERVQLLTHRLATCLLLVEWAEITTDPPLDIDEACAMTATAREELQEARSVFQRCKPVAFLLAQLKLSDIEIAMRVRIKFLANLPNNTHAA